MQQLQKILYTLRVSIFNQIIKKLNKNIKKASKNERVRYITLHSEAQLHTTQKLKEKILHTPKCLDPIAFIKKAKSKNDIKKLPWWLKSSLHNSPFRRTVTFNPVFIQKQKQKTKRKNQQTTKNKTKKPRILWKNINWQTTYLNTKPNQEEFTGDMLRLILPAYLT